MRWLWIIVLMPMAYVPQLYGSRVSMYNIRTSRPIVQHNIVAIHNYFRSVVNPPAANMLMMKWHPGLAEQAQRWANACRGSVHDKDRYFAGFGQSGQNIFRTTERDFWIIVINKWFDEYKDFKYGNDTITNFHEIGHYTQMVWATTHLVGCGVNYCTDTNDWLGNDYTIYVCNYAPGGNYVGQIGHPYVVGEPCSMCRNHCFNNKLCTNACNYSDTWENCAELVRFPAFQCNGLKGQTECRASCTCKDKIY